MKNILESLDEKKIITKGEDPCWDGYRMYGMKDKNGKEVPNCVPESDSTATTMYPEMDHEIEMSSSQLFQIMKDSKMIYDLVSEKPETDGLEAWMQHKISIASDYLQSVARALGHDDYEEINDSKMGVWEENSEVDENRHPGHMRRQMKDLEKPDTKKFKNFPVTYVKNLPGNKILKFFANVDIVHEMDIGKPLQWDVSDAVRATDFHKTIKSEGFRIYKIGAHTHSTKYLVDKENIILVRSFEDALSAIDMANRSQTSEVTESECNTLEETYSGDEFFEAYGYLGYPLNEGELFEAEYQGRKVKLNKPIRSSDGPKKFHVYVKDPKTGNVKKVNFGDPDMRIKKSNPARRKSFRARHNCDNPGPKTKARYWSCKKW